MLAQSQTVAEVLAANVRAFRQLRGLEQGKLARRMQVLGHMWRQVTVSEVERDRRGVSVPELIALTLALETNVEQLLDPRGPERRRGPWLALAEGIVNVSGDADDAEVTIVGPPGSGLKIAPQNVTALVCSHKAYAEVEWDIDRQVLRDMDFRHGRPDLTDVGPEGATS